MLQVYDSRRQMIGAGQERFCGSEVALHRLEGQVALLHHVMAFEEANSGRKILSDTQRWKAQFAAYFLGAVSQGQLSLLERTTTDTAGVAYASPNSWVVKTSKRLSYELRHNSNRALGRLNDAQFENLPMLQAFKWSPVKILAFLHSNSKSRFAIHLQLREFMYERVEHWEIYISVSAFQGRTRYSDIASDESFGKRLTMSDLMSLGKVPLHQEPQLGVHQQRRAPVVGDTWRTGPESTGATLRVRRGRSRTTSWHGSPVRAGRVLLPAGLLALLPGGPRALPDSERRGPELRGRSGDVPVLHAKAPARALRQSQDADLWIRHLARQERVPRPKVDAKVCLRNHHSLKPLTPQTFGSPSTKPRSSSLVEEWRPMRP